ncbi:hypothetical protein Goari_008044 [Gossypium aridum]|uniref:Uncharacterized protein n=1 Tax=Gossypium aridum TaxID=34290 RepID=A0A7J8XU46_GOSAI|nr:hypothetical protein [Gossypium aridum]
MEDGMRISNSTIIRRIH